MNNLKQAIEDLCNVIVSIEVVDDESQALLTNLMSIKSNLDSIYECK